MTTVGCLPPQQAHDAVGDHSEQRAEQRHGRQGKREEKPPRSNSMSAGNRARKGARSAAEIAPPTRTRSISKTIIEGPNASIASTIHCRALPEPVNSEPQASLGWQRASASVRPPCTLISAAGCWRLSSASMCVWVKKSEEAPRIPTDLCVHLFPVTRGCCRSYDRWESHIRRARMRAAASCLAQELSRTLSTHGALCKQLLVEI